MADGSTSPTALTSRKAGHYDCRQSILASHHLSAYCGFTVAITHNGGQQAGISTSLENCSLTLTTERIE